MNNGIFSPERFRSGIPGFPVMVPLGDGMPVPYINLDNAASTPALGPVLARVVEFMGWYSSVHRGAGFLSQLATRVYEEARQAVAAFVNASPRDVVIFTRNTTEAVNKLSYRLGLSRDDVVIITEMEHHSNDLPWRSKARVVRARVDDHGALDLDDLARCVRLWAGPLKLVAVTGASNVTGYVNEVHAIARLAHAYGAKILVDAAQLAPHRTIDMRPSDHPEHLDFVAFSAHKMYAPFGGGALIGPAGVFSRGVPEYTGGGTIWSVTADDVVYAPPPDCEEAGTPNVAGAVALAEAARLLSETGMDAIARHETQLLGGLLAQLKATDGVILYGNPSAGPQRLGVIAFNIRGLTHYETAMALAFEGGIGVRSGCFCARPYVHRLLQLAPQDIAYYSHISAVYGPVASVPGMVRISLGLYNNEQDVDAAADLIGRLAANPAYYADRVRVFQSRPLAPVLDQCFCIQRP